MNDHSARSPDGRRGGFAFPKLAFAVASAGFLLFAPTLTLSFAHDDVDYLNEAANILSGRSSMMSLFAPQNEHYVPTLRLLFAANCSLFGTWFLPWRLLVLAAHVGTALLLAGLAKRYFPERGVSSATALTYVLCVGLSSMWVWGPGLGSVPFALLGAVAAMAVLVRSDRLGSRRSRLIAAALLLIGITFESALVPMALSVALVDEVERRREGKPRYTVGAFSVFCVFLVVAVGVLKFYAFHFMTGHRIGFSLLGAASRSAFLVLVAPFRLFFPGVPLPRPIGTEEWLPWVSSGFGLVVLLAAAAVLAGLLTTASRRLVLVSGLVAAGPLGWIVLVGLGRSRVPFEELYSADRYFAPLLIPVSLLAGAVAASLASRIPGWSVWRRRLVVSLAIAAVLVEVPLHAAAMLRRIPWENYRAHGRRFAQLEDLATRLGEAAEALPDDAPPVTVPDTGLYLPDVHNRRVSTRFLIFVSNRRRTGRLRLGGQRVSPRDEEILNPVLDEWAVAMGEARPWLRISGGELVDAHDKGAARFFVGPAEHAVESGFYDWDGTSRWMGERGVLDLVATGSSLKLSLNAPIAEIRRWNPAWASLPVKVSVRPGPEAPAVFVGTANLADGEITSFYLRLPETIWPSLRGQPVQVLLEVPTTWRHMDVIPRHRDPRLVSVRVFEVAFSD